MKASGETGFTLVELMIVVIISVPILLAVLSTSDRVSRTINTTEKTADVSEDVRKVADRAGRLVRAAHRSTFLTKATAADVSAGKAATVGAWMTAPDLDPRPNIQFQSASGTLFMNAAALTTPRELEFVRDAGEAANGADDDGDGLVDEGKLFMAYESVRVPVVDGVESCSFELDGQAIRFILQCARRDSGGRIHRSYAKHVWWARNP